MTRHSLYPSLRPRKTGHLPRDHGHAVYWEESGNPDGIPVLFLHGGPGAGTAAVHRRFFDPSAYRILLFDQRGCGRSTPFGETAHNTTTDLVGDIEALRGHFGVDQWLLFGGSWGSTLALAYAESHADRVRGLILRGIFLGRVREIEWFLYGMRAVFPEAWRRFAEFLPDAERDDLLAAYYRRLLDPEAAIHLPAARRWSGYETACSSLLPKGKGGGSSAAEPPTDGPLTAGDRWALGLARMESHYFVNRVFLDDGALLAGVAAIESIPGVIVQGRYDIVCPFKNADELAGAWPEAELVVVPDAGHSALEPGITSALVAATEKFKHS
ncbi:MAG: prolyl aminopeptidase [Alphaproteobacteria bacterium]|nr:prolyl aminopeptidase [Alphaproteobacteria bacterium]